MLSFDTIDTPKQIKDHLSQARLVRLSPILALQEPIPIGRSIWSAEIKRRRLPKHKNYGLRTTTWKVDGIPTFIERAT